MVTDSYLLEKLTSAQYALIGEGPIHNRLKRAYSNFALINTDEVHERYRCAFGRIRDALVAKGSVHATLDAMDDDAASNIAASIIDLHNAVRSGVPPACC